MTEKTQQSNIEIYGVWAENRADYHSYPILYSLHTSLKGALLFAEEHKGNYKRVKSWKETTFGEKDSLYVKEWVSVQQEFVVTITKEELWD